MNGSINASIKTGLIKLYVLCCFDPRDRLLCKRYMLTVFFFCLLLVKCFSLIKCNVLPWHSLHRFKSNLWAYLPVVQLPPIHPSTQEVHDPSVCWHLPGWQLGKHIWEQFVPKYPSLQAKNWIKNQRHITSKLQGQKKK